MAKIILILVLCVFMVSYSKKLNFENIRQKLLAAETFEAFMDEYIHNDPEIRFFTYENIQDFLKIAPQEFPNVLRVSEIGKSHMNKSMQLITLGLNIPTNEKEPKESNPPSIFLNSVHHAREVLGVTMNMYNVFNILYRYLHKDSGMISLLKMHNIYVLPFVNPDAYEIISGYWEMKHVFEYIRKNRKNDTDAHCGFGSLGVDLNRNYGYKWGLDNRGSSNSPCEEDYRGKSAFSEPETQNIRDFILSKDKNIKIAINFHSWGNLFIIPMNYDDKWNKELIGTKMYSAYEDIRDSGLLPEGMLFGNGIQTIQYKANGDATDWMSSVGVMSISPELGTKDIKSNQFFPMFKMVKPIIENNFPWVNYTLFKVSAQVETSIIKAEKVMCMIEGCESLDENYERFWIKARAHNVGFSNASNVQVIVEADEDVVFISPDDSKETKKNLTLSINQLNSLEEHLWSFECRIPKDKWEEIKQGSNSEDISQTFITLTNTKYPHIEASQKNTRTLSKASLIVANPHTQDPGVIDKTGIPLYFWAILAAFIILIAIIGFIFCKNKKGTKLEDEEEYEMKEGKFDKVEDSEDGRISIT